MNIDNTRAASLEEMISDYSHGLYDFTVNGKCSGCGGCCSNVLPLTQKEIDRIHELPSPMSSENGFYNTLRYSKARSQLPLLRWEKPFGILENVV